MSLTLHTFPLSGHSHRAELALAMLGLRAELVVVDLAAGAHRAPAFLAKNAFGQVPVLEDGAELIADSNAILVYLATRYDPEGRWLPRDPVGAARVQRWLSVAANQLVRGPALARLEKVFGATIDRPAALAMAAQVFGVMESHLATTPFFAAERPTLADLALYSYTAAAPDGDVSLAPYPRIRAWLDALEALPRFAPMPVRVPR